MVGDWLSQPFYCRDADRKARLEPAVKQVAGSKPAGSGIEQAGAEFLKDAQSRELREATLYKNRLSACNPRQASLAALVIDQKHALSAGSA